MSKVEVSVPSNVLKSHRNVYKIVYLRSMLSISCFHFGFLSTSLILGTDCFLLCVACVCILFSLSYSCFCVQSTVFCSDFFFIFVLLVRLPLFNFSNWHSVLHVRWSSLSERALHLIPFPVGSWIWFVNASHRTFI